MLNAVLSSIPTHYMACFLWPAKGIELLDKIRRHFLWNVKDGNSSGHCLVAWDCVIQNKESGGLGIRNLKEHNKALLCKFLCKILQSTDNPCYSWFASWYLQGEIPTNSKALDTATWRTLCGFITLVQEATKCKAGSGVATAFWFEKVDFCIRRFYSSTNLCTV